MGEFELHQLLLASRYEFDIATAFMIVLGCAAIGISRLRFSHGERLSLALLYLLAQGFCLIRIVASIVRFLSQSTLLATMEASYHPGNTWLQLPTLVLRLALVSMLLYLGTRFLLRPASPPLPHEQDH